MGKIGGLEWDNVIDMIEARLHVSRTHSSLPKNATVSWPLLLLDTSPCHMVLDFGSVIIRLMIRRRKCIGLEKLKLPTRWLPGHVTPPPAESQIRCMRDPCSEGSVKREGAMNLSWA